MRLSSTWWAAAVGAATVVAAGPLSAQGSVRPAGQPGVRVGPAPGWIGIFAGTELSAQGPVWQPIVVLAVAEGSPAARAGLTEGDTLLLVNGVPLTPDGLRALQGLRAGDRIELTAKRGGPRRTVAVRAEARPTAPDEMPDPVEIRLGSTRRLLEADPDDPDAPATPMLSRVIVRAPSVAGAPTLPEADQATPFTVHVFRDARTDSLGTALKEVERRLVAARSAEAARVRELAARAQQGRIDRSDAALVQLRSRREALATEEALLRGTLEQIVAERAGSFPYAFDAFDAPVEWTMAVAPRAEPAQPAQGVTPAPPATVVRPMTPYIAGRDRVAGARVTALNPGLAEYFGTSRGVLVVEVAEGTPAEDAGLRPGDVLLRVGTLEVDGLEQLRRAITAAPGSQPVTVLVLRRGVKLQLSLPR